MLPWLKTQWGNPSSIHTPGRLARRAVEEARANLAFLIGAQPEQVIFTSGATEANNAAIHSAVISTPTRRHIITSAVEHAAVLAFCEYLENRHGIEVTHLPVDQRGNISLRDLQEAIRPDTALVSLMWANNETGVVWPVQEFAEVCAEAGIPFHTDAVQAVGKLPIHFGECGADFLSLSGHKFGAPKGIGALVVSDPSQFEPLLYGGKQENGNRGGTENISHIVGLGTAAEIVAGRGFDRWSDIAGMRDAFEREVRQHLKGALINGGGCLRLPNSANLHFPGIDADALVTFLDQQGICVSSGSACLESAITPSHVIFAMSGSYEQANESIRVTLGLDSSPTDLEMLVKGIRDFVDLLL